MLSATILHVVRDYSKCCPRLFYMLSATIFVVRDYFIFVRDYFKNLSTTFDKCLHTLVVLGTPMNCPFVKLHVTCSMQWLHVLTQWMYHNVLCHIITLLSITDNCHKIVCFIYPSLLQVQATFTCTTSTQGVIYTLQYGWAGSATFGILWDQRSTTTDLWHHLCNLPHMP